MGGMVAVRQHTDTLGLANFRLSRWDERRCQMQFGFDELRKFDRYACNCKSCFQCQLTQPQNYLPISRRSNGQLFIWRSYISPSEAYLNQGLNYNGI
jgi:hypothetical protein